MNPFIAATTDNVATEQADLPELTEYAWDFAHDHFLYNTDGSHKIVVENEALKVWIYKALKTERARYEAYKHGVYNANCPYGVELEQFIGRNKNNIETATKIKQYINDGLLVNPYIKSINNIDITSISGDTLTYTIFLTSIYGSLTTEVTV